MKYHVEFKKGKYCVYDSNDKSMGEFATRREAIAEIRELMKKPQKVVKGKKLANQTTDEGEY